MVNGGGSDRYWTDTEVYRSKRGTQALSDRKHLKLVLRQGIVLAVVGATAGIGVALSVTRYLTSMLYDVHANDPLTMISVAVLLTLVALAACYVPARRAMRVDPMAALRCE
jgi:ABC-type antimicrobial peptide transport system permease subunit